MAFTHYPPQFSLSKEPCWISYLLDPSSPPALYRIKLRVSVRFYNEIYSHDYWFEAFGDADNRISFNLTSFFDEYLGDQFTPPDITSSLPSVINSFRHWLEVGIDYWLYADDTIIEYDTLGTVIGNDEISGYTTNFIVYKGGLTVEKRHDDYFNWKKNIIGAPFPFHTWKSNSRITLPYQPQFLYFSLQDETFSTKVGTAVIKLYDSANTLLSTINHAVTGGEGGFVPGIYSVGLYKLTTPPTLQNVARYTVQLLDQFTEDPISELITYYVDRKYYSDVKYVLYQNGIGGFESFAFRGANVLKTDTERSVAALSATWQQTTDGLRKTFRTSETEIIRLNTQYLLPSEYDELREIMLAPRIYIEDGNKLWPIEPTERTKDWVDSGKYMQAGFIEFRKCFTNEVFMPPNSYLFP